jgi:hypothetical protein
MDLKSKLKTHLVGLKKEEELDLIRKKQAVEERNKELAAANFLECRARIMQLNHIASQVEEHKWSRRVRVCTPSSDPVTYEV